MKEEIKIIFENEKIKVEEILSRGAASPADFWYDNEFDEWVSVTEGEAALEFNTGAKVLKTGENHYIPAHVKHRVVYTSKDCKWLCVYIKK